VRAHSMDARIPPTPRKRIAPGNEDHDAVEASERNADRDGGARYARLAPHALENASDELGAAACEPAGSWLGRRSRRIERHGEQAIRLDAQWKDVERPHAAYEQARTEQQHDRERCLRQCE